MKKLRVIYKPRGRAQEYAESSKGANDGYALNIYKGCVHGCAYCYVPQYWPWKTGENPKELFQAQVIPRKNLLDLLQKDCEQIGRGCADPVHLCFTCDPYPPEGHIFTRSVLRMFEAWEFQNVQILTKGGMRASRDFDIMKKNGWKFGSTVCGKHDFCRTHEQGAAFFESRRKAIETAHYLGIHTWISIEPVIDVEEALQVIIFLRPWVDFWKIGKLNHGENISPELGQIEKNTNWAAFVRQAKAVLGDSKYIFKDSLRRYE